MSDLSFIHDQFPPELYLLLSVDITGSTKLKNEADDIDKRLAWMNLFSTFANDFTNLFNGRLAERSCFEATLLKSLGDELVFYYRIDVPEHVSVVLDSFDDCVCKYYSNNSTTCSKIGFKCTAWLVGTPVANMIIRKTIGSETSQKEKKYAIIDFVGPSMDIGFRIAKYSSHHKFVISFELAYLLSIYDPRKHIYYYGKEILKGVLNNDEYPMFYIESLHYDSHKEKDLMGKYLLNKNSVDSMDLKNFINSFIKNHNKTIFTPFIFSSKVKSIIFGELPTNYQEDYDKIVSEIYRNNPVLIKDADSSIVLTSEDLGKVSKKMSDFIKK